MGERQVKTARREERAAAGVTGKELRQLRAVVAGLQTEVHELREQLAAAEGRMATRVEHATGQWRGIAQQQLDGLRAQRSELMLTLEREHGDSVRSVGDKARATRILHAEVMAIAEELRGRQA